MKEVCGRCVPNRPRYHYSRFFREKKEVKGNKKSVKNTVGKMIELSTGIKKEADHAASNDRMRNS